MTLGDTCSSGVSHSVVSPDWKLGLHLMCLQRHPALMAPITPDQYSLVFYLHPFRISARVFVFDGSHWHQLLQHYFLKVSFSAMTLCSHFHKRASVSALCGLVSTNPLSVPVQLLPILKYCSFALSLESLGHLHHPLAFSLRNILLVSLKKKISFLKVAKSYNYPLVAHKCMQTDWWTLHTKSQDTAISLGLSRQSLPDNHLSGKFHFAYF